MSGIEEDAERLGQVVQAVKDSGAGIENARIEWGDDDSTEFWIVGDLKGGESA